MRHIYVNTLYDYEGDAALVMRVLAGNREAFNILASRYYMSVLRLCVRLLSDPIEAQDVAQETILQAFLGLDRLQQPARFGAWLHAIAGNLARSALRRQRPISFEALDEIERPGLERAALLPNLEQVVAMRETHDTIVAALMELSIVNREAVIGYYLQGYSYAELASLLGVPARTVKSRLFKGRQQLRQSLEHLIHPEPLSPVLERKETTMSLPEHIGLQVEMICEYSLTQRSIVILGALSGNQYLPIRMLTDEALTVERALKSRLDNPLVTSQDLLLQLMVKLGGRIEQVILRSLVKQNYYASLIVAVDGQHHEIDCRLSDALALAIRTQIPVQIAPALLDEAGITIEYTDIDPAVAEAELPDLPEPMTTSDQWPHSFVENV